MTLSGSIARLEPLRAAHAAPLAKVGLDPELRRLQPSMISSVDDMEAYVASALDDEDQGVSLCFVLVSQRTGTVIGTTRFMDIALAHKRLEIGATWITSAHQRTGANLEATLHGPPSDVGSSPDWRGSSSPGAAYRSPVASGARVLRGGSTRRRLTGARRGQARQADR